MQLQNSKHIGNEDQEEYFAQIGFSFTWNNELKLIEMKFIHFSEYTTSKFKKILEMNKTKISLAKGKWNLNSSDTK